MLNYTAKRRDVLVLAHEMGHGLHAELARPRGVLEQGTPLTLAETASVFGETLVFGRLLEQAPTPESRLSLLAESIEGSIATVFRQTAMNQLRGARPHRAPRGGRAGRRALQRAVGAVAGRDARRQRRRSPRATARGGPTCRTSSRRRATSTPTPTASCSRCRSTSATSTRASRSCPATSSCCAPAARAAPRSSAQIVGIDLADPGFWDSGLDLVEAQLEEAEAAAQRGARADLTRASGSAVGCAAAAACHECGAMSRRTGRHRPPLSRRAA